MKTRPPKGVKATSSLNERSDALVRDEQATFEFGKERLIHLSVDNRRRRDQAIARATVVALSDACGSQSRAPTV